MFQVFVLFTLFVSVKSVEFCDVYKDFEFQECESEKGVHIVEFLANDLKVFCISYERIAKENKNGFDYLQFKFSSGYNLTTVLKICKFNN